MNSLQSILVNFVTETWSLTAEMAPYLLLGFVLAGLLRSVFTEDWVKEHLGKKGIRQILKAVIIGIPLPLCSCGVIPVAAGIRRQGGEPGAVAAFTASTPQTGVDSIAATVGMLGWVFAGVRIAIAFVNGIVAGLVVERWGSGSQSAPTEDHHSCCSSADEPVQSNSCDCEPEEKDCCTPKQPKVSLASGLRFGLSTLPGDLFGALTLGLIIAGAIASLAPADLFSGLPGGQITLYLAMTLISLPLYVCSTGSIPMAFTFLHAGMTPGAVLIFLIAGPATNAATVTSLWKLIGGKGTIGYVISIIATCWFMAVLIDTTGVSLLVTEGMHSHDMSISPFQHAMAVILIIVLAASKLPIKKKAAKRASD